MDLDHFFEKSQVIKLKATEKQPIIKELVEKLQELDLIQNKDRYYAQIIHRESLENTGIGNGFAIPHARTESVDDFVSIFGISEEGIDYQAIDNKPVHYILLSIFPSVLSTQYLYLIGMMARLFSNAEKKQTIEEARTPAKIYNALKKEAKTYFDTISKQVSENDKETIDSLQGIPSSDLDQLIRLNSLYQVLGDTEDNESVKKKIEEIKKLIDNRSLTYFERMRKKKSNPFAIVEKNSCTGCHMEISPMYLNEVRETQTISVCEHCGRFLIII